MRITYSKLSIYDSFDARFSRSDKLFCSFGKKEVSSKNFPLKRLIVSVQAFTFHAPSLQTFPLSDVKIRFPDFAQTLPETQCPNLTFNKRSSESPQDNILACIRSVEIRSQNEILSGPVDSGYRANVSAAARTRK